ncbi:Hypothetical predicted protein [Lecanosticta acicola]|uniref:J domain-containing protein n=1 Tax=Lecanosticta acicola TaxID=111012 RepID=A0AAI9EC41_9PEZI|nr:Hypothetical predicted protein [Lecanosticta acicola]
MGSPLPPDPYLALGVSKTATTDQVKKTHRKLVLKCHPDKVTDPAAKLAASDQFHKIQTAYEILVDEERRARYDAQVRLAELRKEAMERQGSGKPRSRESRAAPSPYKSSSESVPRSAYPGRSSEGRAPEGRASERVAPQYEERRPSFATDYFDQPPRATARKEPEYQRSWRRSTHDTKEKTRTSTRESKEAQKEKEREKRREAARKAEQEARRERDRKHNATYAEDDSDSDSDEYTRRSRRMREEDEARRAKEAYREQAYKQKQEASSNGGYFDERTRKMFTTTADAWDYIRSSRGRQRPESERRPSPVRMGSSKDKTEYVEQRGGRPAVVMRRASQRPKTATRDSEDSKKASSRESNRKSSPEANEEPTRRPPTLNQSKSSPAGLHIPPPSEKPRSQSLQHDTDSVADIPKVKRSETMPHGPGSRRTENAAPPKTSNSRPTEIVEGLATPAATPTEHNGPAEPNSTKVNYGRQYADDREYPTPDGYRTEAREPASRPNSTRKSTRSPSPIKEARESRDPRDSREDRRERPEKARAASSRYSAAPQQQPPPNLRSTSYVYTPGQGVAEGGYERSRPSNGRGADPRDPRGYPDRLYGEVRATGSPRQRYSAYEALEEDNVRQQRPVRPESIRAASGYSSYKRGDRPTFSRSGSSNPIYTSARA